MVGRERLELSTPPLSRVCSNQLSYRPMTLHLGSSNDYNVSNLLEINGRETRTVIFVYVKWELKNKFLVILRKEVIQPQVPLRLPCYDFTPVADPTVAACPPEGLAQRRRVEPTPMVWRAVCTRPGNVFTASCCYAITSDSDFMGSSCRPQSELRQLLGINPLSLPL